MSQADKIMQIRKLMVEVQGKIDDLVDRTESAEANNLLSEAYTATYKVLQLLRTAQKTLEAV